jgi:hypothetical protein
MPSSLSFLLLSSAFTMSSALPWSGPRPTDSYDAVDWTPEPTGVPQPKVEIIERDSYPVSVCGWIGGSVDLAAFCQPGSQCVWDSVNMIVGCCPLEGPCNTGVFTGCVDKNSPQTEDSAQIYTWYDSRIKLQQLLTDIFKCWRFCMLQEYISRRISSIRMRGILWPGDKCRNYLYRTSI